MFIQKFCHQVVQVTHCVRFLTNRVRSVRVDHQTERLIELYEFVDELLCTLVVNIVVAGTMYEQ